MISNTLLTNAISNIPNSGFPPTENLGRPEKKWSGKVGELFLYLQNVRECQGTFFLNADYHEINKCRNFHLKNVAINISCSR